MGQVLKMKICEFVVRPKKCYLHHKNSQIMYYNFLFIFIKTKKAKINIAMWVPSLVVGESKRRGKDGLCLSLSRSEDNYRMRKYRPSLDIKIPDDDGSN